MVGVMGKLDSLPKIEEAVAKDMARKASRKKRRKRYPEGKRTRIARDVKAGKRKPPPVPPVGLSDLLEMDPEDESFRHPQGRPRKTTDEDSSWKEVARRDKQERANKRRAKSRKAEAAIVKAVEVLDSSVSDTSYRKGITDEDKVIAEGVLDLSDWDDEELARGYRRDRNGRFGSEPKYIPREVQQEVFRRIVKRADRRMQSSYLAAIERLTQLATGADSEKVQLEAIKEIMNRLVGKVPDTLRVSPDAPWQDMLAESLVPLSEVPPLDLERKADGSFALLDEGAVDAPTPGETPDPPHEAAREVVVEAPAPSSPVSKKQAAARVRAKKRAATTKPKGKKAKR